MNAWIGEDGVLYLMQALGEHAAMEALRGQPVISGPVDLPGIGLAGGFMVKPKVSRVRPAKDSS